MNTQTQTRTDEDKARDIETAKTILQQLGGRRFSAMTGASYFMQDRGALLFRLPGKPNFVRGGINYVKVSLNGNDLYDIVFTKIKYGKRTERPYIEEVSTASDVYAEDLQSVFTAATGLDTHL